MIFIFKKIALRADGRQQELDKTGAGEIRLQTVITDQGRDKMSLRFG